MIFWAVVGFCGAIAAAPFLVRGLRSRWGSPELRATLHAIAIAIALDLLPLVFMLVRAKRSPIKK